MNKYQLSFNRFINHIVQTNMFPNSNDNLNNKIFEQDRKTIQELVEKATPKKPNLEADGYSNGELVYDTWICPSCGKHYEVDYDDYKYCPVCGQRLDWS